MNRDTYKSGFLTYPEIKRMEHCVGFDKSKVYHRSGRAYFKPYRNYYGIPNCGDSVWESIKDKGYADNNGGYYWLNREGLAALSACENVHIYSDNANGNEIDALHDVIDVLLEDLACCYAGYGNLIPTSAKNIAKRARLPLKLTIDTLHYLRDKCGYVKNSYYGECDNEGNPYCVHGWLLTKTWIDKNRERFDSAKKKEQDRIDRLLWGD